MVSGFELYRSQFSILLHRTIIASMAGKVGTKPRVVVANYFASSSEDEREFEEVVDLQSPDFEPFFASFRRYRKELNSTEVK